MTTGLQHEQNITITEGLKVGEKRLDSGPVVGKCPHDGAAVEVANN